MHRTMRSQVLSVLTVLALLISMFAWMTASASAVSYTPDGTMTDLSARPSRGTPGTVWSINTTAEMPMFAGYVNNASNNTAGVTFFLTGNIAMPSGAWQAVGQALIGSDPNTGSPFVVGGRGGFEGLFDGQGYTLSGLDFAPTQSGAGLFGYLAPSGVIQDLTVGGTVNAGTASLDAIGGVVGYNSGTINKVINNVSVTATGAFNVGGIAGFNDGYYSEDAKGIIVNSRNGAAIQGASKAGGIAGENCGVISTCSNTGTVNTANTGKTGAGGIAGRNGNNNAALEAGQIFDCYNTAAITAQGGDGSWAGGVAGFQNALSFIDKCYDTGVADGYQFANPIVGNNETKVTTPTQDNYSLNTLPATSTLVIETGIRRAAADMQTEEFRDILNTGSLSGDVWSLPGTGGYPVLSYAAPVPPPSGGGTTNNLSVVYLGGSTASDDNDGSTPALAVATLGRAVAIAGASAVSTVYVSVQSTIYVNDAQTAYGDAVKVTWEGTATGGVMFNIASGGSLTVSGLVVDAGGLFTAFAVNGKLAVHNDTSVDNADRALYVNPNGFLTLSKCSIGGTLYSVTLADAQSAMTINVAPGQQLAIKNIVYIATGAYISTGISIADALKGNLIIQMPAPASGRVALQRTGSYTFTTQDRDKLSYYGGSFTFKLNAARTQIQIN